MTRKFLIITVLGVLLSSCSLFQKANEKTILIAANTKPCTAGVMETECLQIKWSKNQAEWENFYEQIANFNYEKGYEYELIISEAKDENPPAGGSSVKYTLVKEISKTKVEIQPTAFSDNSQSSLDWDGTYEGILPCADCEGIKTTITLIADGTFNRAEEYLGKNSKPYTDNGKFEWNADGSAITLKDNRNNQKYQVGENQLFHLDNEGNRILGKLEANYVLIKKQNDSAENSIGFEDKKWALISFMGKELKENKDEYFIRFNSKDKSLNTKVGCNVINARYKLENELNLKIDPIMSTLMACPENSIEDEYKANLATVNNITTNGELLHLNRARMTVASFKLVK